MTRKLKICHIGWAKSIHVERLMRWFAEKGHDISIITDKPKKIPGVKVYDIRRKPDPRPRLERYKDFYFNLSWKWLQCLNEIVRIRRLVTEISPDIIHSHSLWHPGYLGVFIKNYPFVLTVMNGDILWDEHDIGHNEKFITRTYKKLFTKWAMKKAGLITGVSKELVNACIRHGADKVKVHIMRRGVDLRVFNSGKDKLLLREELNLPKHAKIVLSPRTIDSLYNLKTLIQSIPKVARKINNTVFVFIGHHVNEKYWDELKEEAMKLKIKDNVMFVGKVDHKNVAKYHQSSDVFVSVSPKDSGPVALQEAMACGAAPVISDLPSVRELIRSDWNGLLVNPDNIEEIAITITRLLEDGELRKSFANRNWEIAKKKCNQEEEMEKMGKLYYELLERREAGR